MTDKKPFLPNSGSKPLAFAVFCFLVAGVTFWSFYFAQPAASTVSMTIFVTIMLLCSLGVIVGTLRFAWIMFVKGGWRDEQVKR